MKINFEINMAPLAWVVMSEVGDVLSKLKSVSFNKGKVIEVIL